MPRNKTRQENAGMHVRNGKRGREQNREGRTEREDKGGLLSASSDRREADLRQQVLEDRE